MLNAAVVVGNPFDLEVSNKTLQSSVLGKELYQRVMGSSCRQVRPFLVQGSVRLTLLFV